MRGNVLFGVFFVVVFVVVVLVWMNRASGAVVGAALPAAAGLVAALILAFSFSPPEPIKKVFPVQFLIEKASRLPVSIPIRPFPDMIIAFPDRLQQEDPSVLEPPDGGFSIDTILARYHHFLQKALVDDLAFKQQGTWLMNTERFTNVILFGATPEAGSYKSLILSREELEARFGTNRFAKGFSGFGKWALPPGTRLQIDVPDGSPGEVGVIRLKNKYCELTITTSRLPLSTNGLGKYRPLVSMSFDEADRYWDLSFVTRIEATFPWYWMGHPDMPLYRRWAEGIVDELSFTFDEESIWTRTQETFLLNRHVTELPANARMAVAPIRTVRPPNPNGGAKSNTPPDAAAPKPKDAEPKKNED